MPGGNSLWKTTLQAACWLDGCVPHGDCCECSLAHRACERYRCRGHLAGRLPFTATVMCAEACGFNVLNVLCCQVVNVHYEFAAKDGLSTMPKIFFASTSKLQSWCWKYTGLGCKSLLVDEALLVARACSWFEANRVPGFSSSVQVCVCVASMLMLRPQVLNE